MYDEHPRAGQNTQMAQHKKSWSKYTTNELKSEKLKKMRQKSKNQEICKDSTNVTLAWIRRVLRTT